MDIYYGQVPKSKEHLLSYNIDDVLVLPLSRYGARIVAELLMDGKYGDVVHTHNALLLNFLPDDFAASSILYFEGETIRRFCESEKLMRKQSLMGPGEIVCDSNEFGEGWQVQVLTSNGERKEICIQSLEIYDVDDTYMAFYDGDRQFHPRVDTTNGIKTIYFGGCIDAKIDKNSTSQAVQI